MSCPWRSSCASGSLVHAKITTAQPDPAEVEGFARYLAAYDKGLDVERTAVEKI